MVNTLTCSASRALALGTVAAVLGLAACGPAEREIRVQPAPGEEGMLLTDAEITNVVMTANAGEIQGGQLALQKSRNNAVREFAQRMITDHTMLSQRLTGLRVPTDGMNGRNPITQRLTTTTQQTLQTLQRLDGMQFDRTYMQNQVQIHQWLLDTLDDALIPSARDNELERTLMDARDVIASHLQQAQQVQATLGR